MKNRHQRTIGLLGFMIAISPEVLKRIIFKQNRLQYFNQPFHIHRLEGAVLKSVEPFGISIRKVTDKIGRSVIHTIQKVAYLANNDITASPCHSGGKETGQQLIFLFIESMHKEHGIVLYVAGLFYVTDPLIEKGLNPHFSQKKSIRFLNLLADN